MIPALDNQNVNRYFGPSDAGIARTKLSFGGFVNFRGGFQWGVIAHFDSPFPEYSDGAEYGNWRRRDIPHRILGVVQRDAGSASRNPRRQL